MLTCTYTKSYTFITGSHGLIEFSIAYDETTTNLLVNVIKAKVITINISSIKMIRTST